MHIHIPSFSLISTDGIDAHVRETNIRNIEWWTHNMFFLSRMSPFTRTELITMPNVNRQTIPGMGKF